VSCRIPAVTVIMVVSQPRWYKRSTNGAHLERAGALKQGGCRALRSSRNTKVSVSTGQVSLTLKARSLVQEPRKGQNTWRATRNITSQQSGKRGVIEGRTGRGSKRKESLSPRSSFGRKNRESLAKKGNHKGFFSKRSPRKGKPNPKNPQTRSMRNRYLRRCV